MMNKYTERLHNGIIKENPTFVMMLGMCPTLAVTSSAINAIGMGLSTAVVLTLSNMMISALRNIIPDRVRIPGFIVVVASFVTIVQLLLKAYLPALDSALGVYIPLIVVNCIILVVPKRMLPRIRLSYRHWMVSVWDLDLRSVLP